MSSFSLRAASASALTFAFVIASIGATPAIAADTGHKLCSSSFTPISHIQGQTDSSPLQGKNITTQGVVTAIVYAGSPEAGITITAHPANDASNQNMTDKGLNISKASSGLFIADSTAASRYQPGQLIQLTGTVTEHNAMTSLTAISHSQVCQTKQTIAPRQIQLPLPANMSWEQLEGQWLSFSQKLVVNDSYDLPRYGEITLAAERLWIPTEIMSPGAEANALYQQQQQQMLVLDDGLWQQNPDPVRYPSPALSADNSLRIGDEVSNISGVLIEDKRGYRLVPTTNPVFITRNPRPAAPSAKPETGLRIASFNVLNYFNGSNAKKAFPTKRGASNKAEFIRQQSKIVSALLALDADVIGLLEVENNGYDTNSAIVNLTQALNRVATARPYQFIRTKQAPGDDAIKVALLYRSSAVKPVGHAALSFAAPFQYGSRVPLAQSFQHLASEQIVTVSINHFKSKGSCNRASSKMDMNNHDGQGCWNGQRVASAKALHNWLASQPTGIHTDKMLILGDLNAYRMEDPITKLEQAGWQYLVQNDKDTTQNSAAYSYVYRGRTGSLDHALATPALAKYLHKMEHWPINADEPAVLDYNLEHKSSAQQQGYYAAGPYRSSDHDPLIATFMF
ncbi:ExeM/NucH family extracellular endonuclease [Rheinheimera salexigens]|uniref:Nuclease n=1 Tax=Rheinheimera salexigens TaxID=1628148 RepID=A0A1E7Q459_9GAMM|nr:ExeM/NucH family extracellular endonuclease [Rheinheimera salexigens]OEY68838.1 nuclease [Rheinheimera salexigens]